MTTPYAPTSWNPTTGCSKVSPGCARCWAEMISRRFSMTHLPWTPEHAAENVVLHPARLEEPLHWRTPRTVAVCFMGDLFHEQVPDEFIGDVFATMREAMQHTFLILTKRTDRMRQWATEYLGSRSGYTDNVYLGVTAENQRMADERIRLLLKTPAAHRWVSLEPLLGPVDLGAWLKPVCGFCWPSPCSDIPGSGHYWEKHLIDGVVVGGESGPGHRPMELGWAKDILIQCLAAGAPCYMKQAAGNRPGQPFGDPKLDGAKELPWQR